jgi:branched-chain amino acid transport system ATP-binding protein
MAGLNPTEVGEMIELIGKIREKGITVLLIEHVMKAIMKLSERVVVLHHGNKISEGTPERVTADPAVVRAYLGAEDEFSANP